MKTFLERGTLQQAERILAEQITSLPILPPLGREFRSMRGTELRDALVVHRIVSQFSPAADPDQVKQIEAASVREMLSYDASYKHVSWRDLQPNDRRTFLGAQRFIADLVKGFKKTYRVKFPKNETHVSASGDTSLVAKLADLDQWTVSADALDYAHRIVWHNQALRKMVKTHFRDKYKLEWRAYLSLWKREAPLEVLESDQRIAFYMIGKMFRSLVTIVGTSRISSVPKNNRVRRVITLEPMWNMICQLSFALDLRDCLRAHTGLDLSWLARWHQERIRSGDATIDKKAASNSNWWARVLELWPRKITKDLARLRTGIAEYKGEYYPLNMMAPMGCGFTFEIMTITLLAYTRQFCKRSTVFGDDVIISPEGADAYIEFVQKVGWQINEQKSFTTGNFRESCGAFIDLSSGEYLLSYDFPPIESHGDIIVTLNKLRDLWLRAGLSSQLRDWIVKTWIKLASLVPSELCSWPTEGLQAETVDFRPLAGSRRCRRTKTCITEQQSRQLQRVVELCHTRLVKRPQTRRLDDDVVGYNASVIASRFNMVRAKRTIKSDRCDYMWCDEFRSDNSSLVLYEPLVG